MKHYCRRRTGGPEATEKSWSVRWRQKKLLLCAPLLRWYVEHGEAITAVHRTIDYSTKIFAWFVEQVTKTRLTGDRDKSKVLLAEVFKLLENSAYGKMIEALENRTCVVFTKDEKIVECALRSAYFGQAYELENCKPRITINRRSRSASPCTS